MEKLSLRNVPEEGDDCREALLDLDFKEHILPGEKVQVQDQSPETLRGVHQLLKFFYGQRGLVRERELADRIILSEDLQKPGYEMRLAFLGLRCGKVLFHELREAGQVDSLKLSVQFLEVLPLLDGLGAEVRVAENPGDLLDFSEAISIYISRQVEGESLL